MVVSPSVTSCHLPLHKGGFQVICLFCLIKVTNPPMVVSPSVTLARATSLVRWRLSWGWVILSQPCHPKWDIVNLTNELQKSQWRHLQAPSVEGAGAVGD